MLQMIGEVPTKVWMRGCRVFHRLCSSGDVLEWPAPARQIVAFFVCLAISETASKSPSEAIGKPASMTSTPISSSSAGDLQLFLERHGGAGRLLAVAQGRVEDQDSVVGGHVGMFP
jgi:hypothetical protein